MSIKIASMNFGDCDTILHNTPNGMKNIAEVLGPNGEVYWSSIKELTGIPPLSIRSNGTILLDYLISGNMSQAGTPTPTTPIQPQGTGERTGNLAQWEKGGISTTTGADEAYRTAAQGGTCEQLRSLYIPCYGNADYVLHTNHYPIQTFISYYDADKNYISRSSGTPQGDNRVFTTPETARYMRAQLAHVVTGQVYPAIEENQQYAITFGSTALPYEPYGYKIPILSANTTTPVYLGEVQTTRKIKKLVLTGGEFWRIWNGNYYSSVIDRKGAIDTIVCSHFINSSGGISYSHLSSSGLKITAAVVPFVTSVSELKAWLAQQYANGTPVTVWYVLATPKTAVVNEPLRKIGDYADTVSMEQAGVQIPTNRGNTVIDVDTTLKPSQMYIKYK